MSKTLTVGNESFLYPENGENPSAGWGEEATSWAEAVTTVLGTLQNANDITLTTFSLLDNISVAANIVGLRFSTVQVIHVKVEFIIERIVGTTVYAESGYILGNYDGTDFFISQESVGDAEITISVTNAGQFQYTSSNLGHDSCTIKFKANTISN